ncbi:MAG: DNA-directed DNA polymerase II small subunit [Candidatus Hermodarchaeia archaeon]|jgi:DNA polymerase II small subunit
MEDRRSTKEQLKGTIATIISSGYQLDPEGLIYLQKLSKEKKIDAVIKTIISRLSALEEKPLFITKKMLEETMDTALTTKSPVTRIVRGGEPFHAYAKEIDSEIAVLEEKITLDNSPRPLDNYLELFKDRYNKIEKIFKKRLDSRDAVTIKSALDSPQNTKVKTIGMVTEKRESAKNIFIRIEDYETSVMVLVPSTIQRDIFQKAQRIFLDQVVCIEGRMGRNDLLIATNLINPDIPEKKHKKATDEVYAALLSDLHIGSREFLNTAFQKFLHWLKGKNGTQKQKEIAGRIKYLIIAGDIVDGIGIYPDQERDLSIKNVYEQYQVAAKIIEQIPEYIDVIISPGNHDATRQALPQPQILKEYAEPIYERRNVLMVRNPTKICLHGVNFLIYHGRSLDDVIRMVPEVTYQNLNTTTPIAMRHLLKVRHLAPTYGMKTPIAPLPTDTLVIDTPPDIFHAGHLHIYGYEMYRGTLIINSGTWQSKTPFQERMGLTPTPGIVPIVDLKSFNIMPLNFLASQ